MCSPIKKFIHVFESVIHTFGRNSLLSSSNVQGGDYNIWLLMQDVLIRYLIFMKMVE